MKRLDWRGLLADADAMLDHVDAREPGWRAYLHTAAATFMRVTAMPVPRDRADRAAWQEAGDRVERRIAPYGCAGCLAMGIPDRWAGATYRCKSGGAMVEAAAPGSAST